MSAWKYLPPLPESSWMGCLVDCSMGGGSQQNRHAQHIPGGSQEDSIQNVAEGPGRVTSWECMREIILDEDSRFAAGHKSHEVMSLTRDYCHKSRI